jgi:large subunit ribosomal protein L7Ae
MASEAAAKEKGQVVAKRAKPFATKFGLNHVTTLVESKKAKMVVIASDVDPVELVLWLPALCRKMDVPYAIVNNKGRLGSIVHLKKSAVVALTDVRGEDNAALAKIVDIANAKFANNRDLARKWGGGKMGLKTNAALEKRAKAVAAEMAKRAAL